MEKLNRAALVLVSIQRLGDRVRKSGNPRIQEILAADFRRRTPENSLEALASLWDSIRPGPDTKDDTWVTLVGPTAVYGSRIKGVKNPLIRLTCHPDGTVVAGTPFDLLGDGSAEEILSNVEQLGIALACRPKRDQILGVRLEVETPVELSLGELIQLTESW